MPALGGRALETVYGEVESGGEEIRLRVGLELHQPAADAGRFRLNLYGEREESEAQPVKDAMMLEGRLGF